MPQEILHLTNKTFCVRFMFGGYSASLCVFNCIKCGLKVKQDKLNCHILLNASPLNHETFASLMFYQKGSFSFSLYRLLRKFNKGKDRQENVQSITQEEYLNF